MNQHPRTILPDVALGFILRTRLLDRVLRRRARDILARSGLAEGLPRRGWLLDLGAGTGHLAEAVLEAGPERRCLLVDPAYAPAPRLMRRLAGRDSALLRADGAALPFPAGMFDGAWAAFVLHHLAPPDQECALAELRRVLRPGAPFVLLEDTPADAPAARATARADRRLNLEPAGAPHHYRRADEWPGILARHGLTVTEQRGFEGIFPRAGWHRVHHTAYRALASV